MGFINPGRDSYGRLRGQRRKSRRRIVYPSPPLTDQSGQSRSPTPLSTSSSLTAARRPTTKKKRTENAAAVAGLDSKRRRRHHRHRRGVVVVEPSRLERLPTELLQTIFLASANTSLPAASPVLARTLAGRHLQLQYVREHRHEPEELTRIFSRRFFSAAVVRDYEAHFSETLDARSAFLPLQLCSAPWSRRGVELLRALASRGAVWDPEESQAVTEGVHAALRDGRPDAVRAVLLDETFKVGTECLRLAILNSSGKAKEEEEEEEEEQVGLWNVLVERGADAGAVGVWRAALALPDALGGRDAVEWLLDVASPPGDVLGELSVR